MKTFKRDILKAGAVLLITTLLPISTAFASEQDKKKEIDSILPKSADKKESPAAKTESPGDKKNGDEKKKEPQPARRKTAKPARKVEPLPNERLTIRQVLAILKTSRDFAGKNLSGLYMVGLDLSKCNFRGADLSKTNLERVDLSESVLERANLSGSNMQMTDLRITGLKGARFFGAKLDGAVWEDGTICGKGSTGICRDKH